MLRPALLILLLVPGCTPLQRLMPRGDESARLAAGVTIVRDEWGVPHVLGESDAHVAFGAGYVQAEDDFQRLEDTYLRALGRAAHWYGARHLPGDLLAVAFEVERLAREEYQREPAERRAFWDAFAEGINWWIRTSGERPRLITHFEGWMPFAVARMLDPDRVVDGVSLDTIATIAGAAVDAATRDSSGRSTAMAVSPSRTGDGRALLLHIGRGPFFDALTPYEMMLASATGWRVRGFAQLGLPLPYAGYNGSLAWARTETTEDVADVYRVAFDDALAYTSHGTRDTARAWQDTLQVNSPEGVRPLIVTLRSTRQGPVITRGDTALAVRIARMQEGGSLQQLYAIARAGSLDGFRAALADHGAVANTIYADTTGNILAVSGGAVPARDSTVDWSRPVDAALARTEWRGWLPIEAVINPSRGAVHSAGDSLPAAHEDTWTFDAWSALPFDAQLHGTEDAIAALASEWERIGGLDATRARRLDDIVDLLRSWNAIASTESAEATLYILWQERLREAGYVDEYARFRAMEDVVAILGVEGDAGPPPWGEVNRLQRVAAMRQFSDERASLPVGGAPWWTGAAFELNAEGGPGLPRYGVSGVTFVFAVQLAPGATSRSIVTFGQSADSASAHWLNQGALYAGGSLKPGSLAEQAVQSGARRVYHPGER